MSLSLALTNAVSAMKLNQESLSVLSQNIANVNTPGYSREQINQSAVYIGGMGNGVQIDDITRKVDSYLQNATIMQTSQTQSLSTVNDYYQNIQNLLGTPGADDSLDSYMSTFFDSMQTYADQPELTSARSNFVNSANTLATQVSGLANQLESLRLQADSDLSNAVDTVNTTLKTLYKLNGQIGAASGLGQSTAGLLDQRDTALQTLAQNMDINITYNANGTVTVANSGGVPLVDGNLHQLQYQRVSSANQLINDQSLSPVLAYTYDQSGAQLGQPNVIMTGGPSGSVQDSLSSGTMQGLQNVRDNLIPQVLDQLDELASNLRDSMNTLQNQGTGYPPATSLTGTRAVEASQTLNMSGSVQIAVLNSDGSPVKSPYSDDSTIRPLTIDLSQLTSTDTPGQFTVQSLVNEINNYYGTPQNKVELGNLNNIQLASDTTSLPNQSGTFNFNLDLSNISADPASVFVTNVSVADDQGNTIPNAVTQDVPSVALDTTNTYTTNAGFSEVQVQLASTSNIKVGDTIYLGPTSLGSINGISPSAVSGYVKVTAVSGNTITFDSGQIASTSGTLGDTSGVVAKPVYATSAAGTQARTTDSGDISLNLSSDLTSTYYTVTADVGVMGADGVVHTSTVTYKVPNGQNNTINQRYTAQSASGEANVVIPNTSQPALTATLVDANGNPVPEFNGKYVDEPSYLKITGNQGQNYTVSINEMDSKELGNPDQGSTGTGWGLSHYFGLNDFFDENTPTASGDAVKNSALNLSVQQRIQDNPNLVSAGKLQAVQDVDPTKPSYSYAVYPGDNSIAESMAGLSSSTLSFAASGGLPSTQTSLTSYTAQMLGYLASLSSGATDSYNNSQSLLDGFTSRAQAVSGVNLDQELANTIIFQNAYSASAKLVSVVDDMFKTLMDSVGD